MATEVARVIAAQDTYGSHTKELQRDEGTLLQTSASVTAAPALDTPAILSDAHHQTLLGSEAPPNGAHPAGQQAVA